MRKDLYQQMYQQEEDYWWHRAKRRLVTVFLPERKSFKILDIGCGTGKLLEELQDRGQVWGVDQSQTAVSFCRQRGLTHVYHDTFPQLKKINGRFDLITCLDVLEHIQDDSEAINTLLRHLKSGGRIVLTVPAYPALFSYWDKILGHKRRYTKASLLKLFETNDLKIIKLSFAYSFLLPPVILFRLVRQRLFKNKKAQSDFIELPQFLHTFLYSLASIEQGLINYVSIPFGLSILLVAEKQ